MSDEQLRIIRRILRVNHAGEHGAVSIYGAQIVRARRRWPDLLPWLEETRDHEVEHRARFLDAMPERSAKPCRALYVWKYGGALLGSITALLGRDGVLRCTVAVERTVHGHLCEQIEFLETRDPPLGEIVRDILREENEHLAHAQAGVNGASHIGGILERVVAAATEVLICLSTRGDSLRLKQLMRAAV